MSPDDDDDDEELEATPLERDQWPQHEFGNPVAATPNPNPEG